MQITRKQARHKRQVHCADERTRILGLIDSALESHRGHRDAAETDFQSMYAHGAINALHLLRERITGEQP